MYPSTVSFNDGLQQLAVHVHPSRKVESHTLQQSTPVLPRSFDGSRHLEGVFCLGSTINQEEVLLRWWEIGS